MSFLSRYKWHFLFWAVYFAFWTTVSIKAAGTPLFLSLLVTLSWVIGQGALGYYCIYRLFPLYFNTRRYAVFSLILTAALVISTFCILGLQILVFALAHKLMPYSIGADLGYILLGNLYSIFLVIAIKSIRDKVRNDRRTQLLEKEKTENELHFLKSQMNPHFLFNALNSIYVLIRKDPDVASHTLLKFADMLRYQLYECNADRIPIEKEIVYLDNYIGLERLRKGSTVCIEYHVGEEVGDFSIAPLLIIPFVENAFKYVSSYSDMQNHVGVDLRRRNDLLELSVENTFEEDAGISQVRSSANGAGGNGVGGIGVGGGIGLGNVRRRLELIYSGLHQLDIRKEGKKYSVVLKIPVQ
jgi:two-component system LytT family sensor kinase